MADRSPVHEWTGRVFEDLIVGDRYRHPFAKTITQADNQFFTLLTQNVAKVHVVVEFARGTPFGRPLVNSAFVLALVTGQSTIDVSFNVFANLGWDNVRLPAPVFEGDTICARSEVLSVRASRSRSDVGIVQISTEGMNQDDVTVISFNRTFMVYRRGEVPLAAGRSDHAS